MFLKANKTGSELYTMHGFDIRHDEPFNYYRRIYNDVVGWKKVSIIRYFVNITHIHRAQSRS
jgi:hypothetical protein